MAGFIDKIFDKSMPGLTKALDLSYRRHQAITSNIANAETPLYRAVDVNFAGELDAAFEAQSSLVKTTNPKHLDEVGTREAHLSPDLSGATKPDGNNVDIDIQMGKLAYNGGQYTMATNVIRKQLGVLKRIISESR